jgi:hypothetical protein
VQGVEDEVLALAGCARPSLEGTEAADLLREYDKLARQWAAEGTDYPRYLQRLTELEMSDRERRTIERRIKQAKFPAVKSLDSFDFAAVLSLNKNLMRYGCLPVPAVFHCEAGKLRLSRKPSRTATGSLDCNRVPAPELGSR